MKPNKTMTLILILALSFLACSKKKTNEPQINSSINYGLSVETKNISILNGQAFTNLSFTLTGGLPEKVEIYQDSTLISTLTSGLVIDNLNNYSLNTSAFQPGSYNIKIKAYFPNSIIITESITLLVTIVLSSNCNLSNLILSGSSLSPVFNKTVLNYSAVVNNSIATITVLPTTEDDTANIKVNDVTVLSGNLSGNINLNIGLNTLKIKVTAQDNTYKTYVINITRSSLSSNAALSGLTLSSGSMSPIFNSSVYSYSALVNNATTSIQVTPIISESSANIKVNGNTVLSGNAAISIPLNYGDNTVTVLITAQDGITTSTYNITINRNYRFAAKWGSYGTGNGQFNKPSGFAKDSLGNYYVVDSGNNRIQKFDSNFNFILKWGSYGTGSGQFYLPMSIAIDSANNIYVTDFHNQRIQKFNSNGTYLALWSYPNGGFSIKYHATSGNLFVAYANAHEVIRYTTNGAQMSKITTPGYSCSFNSLPIDMVVDSSGNMYIVDIQCGMLIYNSNGTFNSLWDIYAPHSISMDSLGNIFVFANGTIRKYDSSRNLLTIFGSYGTGDGQFQYDVDLRQGFIIESNGAIYSVDTNNHRIQKFN